MISSPFGLVEPPTRWISVQWGVISQQPISQFVRVGVSHCPGLAGVLIFYYYRVQSSPLSRPAPARGDKTLTVFYAPSPSGHLDQRWLRPGHGTLRRIGRHSQPCSTQVLHKRQCNLRKAEGQRPPQRTQGPECNNPSAFQLPMCSEFEFEGQCPPELQVRSYPCHSCQYDSDPHSSF
jgi:hypothetical protein